LHRGTKIELDIIAPLLKSKQAVYPYFLFFFTWFIDNIPGSFYKVILASGVRGGFSKLTKSQKSSS